MEKKSLPRFKRVVPSVALQLTDLDHDIIRLVHRHRFLRSRHIVALLGGSEQRIVRRLHLLFHHGYLERPRAQLQYFERVGSQPIAYGLGKKGGEWLLREGFAVDADAWGEKNNAIGRVFLEHTLLVSDIMVATEIACQNHGIRLIYEDELPARPFQWWVKIAGGIKLGVVPDRVFALEYADKTSQRQRAYFFLEADRGTMPVIRKGLTQTSFFRKLLAYEATWIGKVHQRHLDIQRFRVLTVTTIDTRVKTLLDACSRLKRGHGLFLFTSANSLNQGVFSPIWLCGKGGAPTGLLNEIAQFHDRTAHGAGV